MPRWISTQTQRFRLVQVSDSMLWLFTSEIFIVFIIKVHILRVEIHHV